MEAEKELSEQVRELENQLERVRSERVEEIAKLSSEKKALQDRQREELEKVVNERDALAEKLKSAEAGRKRSDEELKQYAMENVTREVHRQSLEVENIRLREVIAENVTREVHRQTLEVENIRLREVIAEKEESIHRLRGWVEYYRDDIKSLYTELQEDRPKKKKKTPGRNV